MVAKKSIGHCNDRASGSCRTARKHGRTFWVLRLRSETYDQLEVWGGYSRASAAAQQACLQAVNEMTESLRRDLASCYRQGRLWCIASQGRGIRL